MRLSDRVAAFLSVERQTCQLLAPESVRAHALAATRFYVGYGHNDLLKFMATLALPVSTPLPAVTGVLIGGVEPAQVTRLIDASGTAGPLPPVDPGALTDDVEVTESDWTLIRPLFLLYIEREQALMLESTRVMGADPFGRSSSEVASDISLYESDLGRKAFIQPIISI